MTDIQRTGDAPGPSSRARLRRKAPTAVKADYVIVGAGSAGCVLANRLSEEPGTSVVLIEAGGSMNHPNVIIPAAFAKQFKTKFDWDFATEPEPHCANRSLYLPRGKGVGGSSSMNAMLYVRGRASDYDDWGVPGWAWSDMLPMFLRAEHNERGPSEFHATGGPLNVADPRSPSTLTTSFLESAANARIPASDDYNGVQQDGASLVQVTQKNGRRWSAADAYLKPVLTRPNLDVVTGALVTAVDTDGGRATGVTFVDSHGRKARAEAGSEVILAAGAFGSPQILMLSGIGPAGHLRRHGIDVVADSPGVGENLQDHPFVSCCWQVRDGTLADAERLRHLLSWLFRRHGPLTSSVAEAFAYVRSRTDLTDCDLQFHFAPAYFVDHGFAEFDGHAFTSGPVLVTPRSRGNVRLRSADPSAKPLITTNSLASSEDVAALVSGIHIAREIAGAEPLATLTTSELRPGSSLRSDAEIETFVRENVDLLYHPVGTCAMGSESTAVVNPELRVNGIDGLRVVDASIMPVIPSGNTNAPTIAVAERGADLIRGRRPSQRIAAASSRDLQT